MAMSLPEISLAFTDFPGPFNPGRIRSLIERNFKIRDDVKDPDFVIYSVFGREFLKYPRAIRIFFTGENVHPDFNLCDYAFGYDWLDFSRRHFRAPNYVLYEHYEWLLKERQSSDSIEEIRNRRFCNFIYSNGDAHPFRDEVFHALNGYDDVDSAGAHLPNTTNEIGPAYKGDWWTPKVEFQKNYKFTIAFENSSTPGYTTEKLVHALASGTIPIYWGNPEVGREFNEERFVNCHPLGSAEAVVERVRQIDQSDSLRRSILSKPFFPGGDPIPELTPDAVANEFCRILCQPAQSARRRNDQFWGRKYESARRREAEALALLESRKPMWRGIRWLSGWNRCQRGQDGER